MAIKYPCGVCSKEVVNDAIECDLCCYWIHRHCAKLKKNHMKKLSDSDAYYSCPSCINLFPFNGVDNDELTWLLSTLNINENLFYYYKKCNGILLDPFDHNEYKCNEWESDKDPDVNFYSNVDIECDYYIEDQFKKQFAKNNFSILHLNARSLKANFTEINNYVGSLDKSFDIIAISETWLDKSVNLNDFCIPNYNVTYTNRCDKRGGGVLLYVNKDIHFKKLENYSVAINELLEIVTIELQIQGCKNVIISCIYRTPGSNIEQFTEYIETYMKSINSNKTLYMCGDFNIDLLKHNNHKNTKVFLEMMYSYGMLPLINKPTRVTENSATLIDNIFTNNCFKSHYNAILCTDLSDHLPIVCTTELGLKKNNPKVYKHIRQMKDENISAFKKALEVCKWDQILSCLDVNEAYTMFLSIFKNLYDTHFPIKKVSVSNSIDHKPWMSKSLINACKKKEFAI